MAPKTPTLFHLSHSTDLLNMTQSALDKQVAGNHYKDLVIQPVQYIHANNIGYFEGNVIKYVSRWESKGGISDLEKAKHYLELLIEMETNRQHDLLVQSHGGTD